MQPVCLSSTSTEPPHTKQGFKSVRKPRVEPLIPSTQRTFTHEATKLPYVLEYSAHACTKRFLRELAFVFPSVNTEGCLIVPTFQPCQYDLVAVGDDVAKEKDDKLESFYDWANRVCKHLHSKGYWADFTDPASGYPIFSERGPSYYPDVIGAELFLKYELVNTGCCQIMYHPVYGTKSYPATMFTTAPASELAAAIERISLRD
ncbi:hypothetical protein K493DRAFT_306429 [Basidiobolus meristosporus CBS 931.73]|uniref:Methylmalonic aciduria and homocystinuria type D protein n=1 Tax=Basidiobolus meristosporus CBS 931.73 TaxID=1314790 RepID=A0A1Y1XSD0_9FUNG|nr:hypothetical protein K493DRAFT_306429 [Basidiobolus meristosporus CBS 931.73]|eukprot:ORX88659.1 hypothetical protein K493DRAFT_306429 [Basidiobolus meristosporus CBS 931.73]